MFLFFSHEKDLRFSEDPSRRFCSQRVVAKKIFQFGDIIPGMHCGLASCPENIDFKLNFYVVNINKVSYSLSFVNQPCKSNCKNKQIKEKKAGFF